MGKRIVHQPEAIGGRDQSKHADHHGDCQNQFRFHNSENPEPTIYCAVALALFESSFQGCISYRKTPDFAAGSFATIALCLCFVRNFEQNSSTCVVGKGLISRLMAGLCSRIRESPGNILPRGAGADEAR